MATNAERIRDFNRYYTQRIGILTDRYLGQARPLGEARLLFEIGVAGADVRELRARLGLDPGYLSRLVRSLEGQDLVLVTSKLADGRVHVVNLTEDGLRELDELNARATRMADELLAGLVTEQQERLVGAMDQVRTLLRLAIIKIQPTDPASPIARSCLSAYADELRSRFPEGFDDDDLLDTDELSEPTGVLLTATEHGAGRACGAVRAIGQGVGEVRHMWVHPDARGIGLGRRLLLELERTAAQLDMHTLQLGTHEVLTEAIAMYRSSGFTPIPRYGDTAHTDCWFEKKLEPNA